MYQTDISNTIIENPKLIKIIEELKHHPSGLNSSKIASLTKINQNTCRTYCNKLHKFGILIKPTRGFYCINPKYGSGLDEPVVLKVHNIRVKVFVGEKIKHNRVVETVGNVKFDVSFGSKRSKIYCIISCDEGLDFNGFCLAICRFKCIVWGRLGLELCDNLIEVDGIELNEDYFNLRIEKAGEVLTVQTVRGSLERIYNKGVGLRSEVKVKPDSLSSIYMLLKGGTSGYNMFQEISLLKQNVKELSKIEKFQNELLAGNNRLLQAILDRLLADQHESVNMSGIKSKKYKKR